MPRFFDLDALAHRACDAFIGHRGDSDIDSSRTGFITSPLDYNADCNQVADGYAVSVSNTESHHGDIGFLYPRYGLCLECGKTVRQPKHRNESEGKANGQYVLL